jgi:hypothetical protein
VIALEVVGGIVAAPYRADSTAIAADDLLYNVNDPMAHGRARNPHESFD